MSFCLYTFSPYPITEIMAGWLGLTGKALSNVTIIVLAFSELLFRNCLQCQFMRKTSKSGWLFQDQNQTVTVHNTAH